LSTGNRLATIRPAAFELKRSLVASGRNQQVEGLSTEMARGDLALTVLLLAAFGGSMALKTASTAASSTTSIKEQSESAAATASEPSTSAYSATEILKEFLVGQDMQMPPGQDLKSAVGKLIQKQSDPRFKYYVDSIIAMVPDPIESGLSLKLDNEIDAIQRAAESEGYVLDRYKLPWPTPSERAGTGPAAEIDQSEESEPTPSEAAHSGTKPMLRAEPGIFLFRDGRKHRLLVVFVIGETPTSGVHKPALRRALQQACELRKAFVSALPRGDCGSNCPPISIMGPAFSGSQDSLVYAIHDWRSQGSVGNEQTSCPDAKIRIISGSATSVDQRLFQNSDNVDFKATVIPDRITLEKVSQWILVHGMGSKTGERVAILSESNTGYGIAFQDLLLNESKQRNGPFKALLSLKFPIHISELQQAIQMGVGQPGTSNSLAAALGNSNLPLAASSGRERRDIVPIYSTSEINSVELVLDQLLESIKQQQISCVIIAASNVEDTVFLAEEVHNSSPNVMMISLDANLLFLHSEVNPQLQGVFVASAYPLFTANQVWTNPFWGAQLRIQFPSEAAEGEYNATVALLGGDTELLDYGNPFDASARIPPLWITVIGSGGVWPLETFPIKDDQHYIYVRADWSSSQYPIFPWPGWPAAARLELLQRAILVVTLLLCALWAIAYAKPGMLPALIDQSFAGAALDEGSERRTYQAAVLFLLIAELAIAVHYVSFKRFHGLEVATPADETAALLSFRASSLGSRVSPLTPILFGLGAGLALCLGALRRTRLRESRQVQTPFLDFETPSFSGVVDLEGRVRRALSSIELDSPVWWLAATLIVAVYATLYWQSGRWPVDGPTFAGLFFVISLAAYTGIAYAVYKLIAVWLSTRRLMRRLYWHPSRPGYEKFRAEISAGHESRMDMLSSAPSLAALEAGLAQVRKMIAVSGTASESARDFAGRTGALRDSLRESLKDAEQALVSIMVAYGKSLWRDEIRFKREAEDQMSALSRLVARAYEPFWQGAPEPSQGPDAKDGERSALNYGEIYVASRVVDWLRQVMPQLQALAFSATAAMIMMLFAISSYPFPLSDRLLWFSWTVGLVTVGSMAWMFVSANRDRVMSLISGTTPGHTDWNLSLLVNLGTHALLPLVVLLGAAFPERLSRLATWLGGVFGGHG